MNDLRSAMGKAFDEHIQEEESEEVSIEEETTEELDDVVEEDSSEELEEDAELEESVEELEASGEETDFVEEEEVQLEPIEPPTSWNAESKAAFAELPRGLQEEVARIEKEQQKHFTQRTQELSNYRRNYEEVDRAFEPYLDNIRMSGQTPGQVVSTLLAWDSHIRNNPTEAIQAIAANNGIDLNELVYQQSNADPAMQRVSQLERMIQQQQEEAQKREQAQLRSGMEAEVNSFSTEVDTEGNLLRPHINDPEIIQEMSAQIGVLRSINPGASNRDLLQEAYNRALSLNPKFNVEADAEKRKAEEAKRLAAKKKKVAQAKKAGSSLKSNGSTSNAVKHAKVSGTRNALDAAWQELGIN